MKEKFKFWRNGVNFWEVAFPATKKWQLAKLAILIIVLTIVREVIIMYGATIQ